MGVAEKKRVHGLLYLGRTEIRTERAAPLLRIAGLEECEKIDSNQEQDCGRSCLYSAEAAPLQSLNLHGPSTTQPSALRDPKVSIVIPVYNEKSTIDEILRRVSRTQERQ